MSASSNLIGFYNHAHKPGEDYPKIIDWPIGYVPIPIHSYQPMNHDEVKQIINIYI